MPRHFAHYYFSQKMLEEMEGMTYAMSAIIRLYPDAYLLGSLGADVLAGTEHKSRLEQMSPVQLFSVTAHNIFVTGSKCKLAYMLGYVSHYALDKAANPYIYHFAANGVAGYFGGKEETQSTANIEIGIDRHIIRDYLGVDKALELVENLSVRPEVIEEISKLYAEIINDVADVVYSERKMLALFHSVKPDMPLSEGLGRLDFMNREHRVWRTVGQKKISLSFDELMVKGLSDAYALMEEYMLSARSNKPISDKTFALNNYGVAAKQ